MRVFRISLGVVFLCVGCAIFAQEKPRPVTQSDPSGYVKASDLDQYVNEIYDRVRQRMDVVIDSLVGRDTLYGGDDCADCAQFLRSDVYDTATAGLVIKGTKALVVDTIRGIQSGSAFMIYGTPSIKTLTTTVAGNVILYEGTANGINYIVVSAPNNMTTTYVFTLPDGDGNAGDVLKTDGSGNTYWEAP